MLSIYGRIYAAVGGLAALFALGLTAWFTLPRTEPVTRENSGHSPRYEYRAAEVGCEPSQLAATPVKKREDERRRCANARQQHDFEQRNLAQATRSADAAERQADMANWQARSAFIQAIATVSALFAAFGAAVAAVFAAIYAKKAATHTDEGAKAAIAANKLTEDVSHRELTAYLQISGVKMGWTSDGRPTFRFYVHNSGQTPAIHYKVGAIAKIDRIWVRASISDAKYMNFSGIGAGNRHRIAIGATGQDALNITTLKDDLVIFVKGSIKYFDVFDKYWESPFVFFTDRTIRESWIRMEPGVDTTPIRRSITAEEYSGQ